MMTHIQFDIHLHLVANKEGNSNWEYKVGINASDSNLMRYENAKSPNLS